MAAKKPSSFKTVLAWIFGVLFIMGGIGGILSASVAGVIILVAGVVILPPTSKKLTAKWPFFAKTWVKVTLGIVAFVAIGATAPDENARPVTDREQPAMEQAASSRSAIPFVFDVPALVGKNSDQVKAALGKPSEEWKPTAAEMKAGINEADMTFVKDGQELMVTYDIKTRAVIDLFLSTDDASGSTADGNRLLDIAHLTLNSSAYHAELIESMGEPGRYTGVKVITTEQANQAAADRAEREAAEKNIGGVKVCAKNEVTSMLKAPSTAEFPWSSDIKVAYSTQNNNYDVLLWVDSENSFGAKLRTNFICTVAYDDATDRCSSVCQAIE